MGNLLKILNVAGTDHTKQRDWGKTPFIITFLANCLWPLSWIYSNQQKISFAQSTMARGIVTLTFSYLACLYSGDPNSLKYPTNFKLLVIRSILMTMHSFVTGFSQFILPLPVTFTIGCSGTIFVFILDYFVNGIKINANQLKGILLGLLGVFLTGNGKLLTKLINNDYQYHSNYQNYIFTDTLFVGVFTVFYILITIGWAYGIILTRLAKANTFQINFVLGVVFYAIGTLAKPYMPLLGFQNSTFSEIGLTVLLTGVPTFLVQMLVITSLTMTKQAGVLNIMSYSMIFVSYLVSIFWYRQKPNIVCLLGVILVVYGCTKTVMSTNK